MTDFAAGSRHHATQSLSSPSSPQTTRASLPRSRLLEALYRDERAGVLAYLKRKVGHEHASDLAQEVFLRAAGSAQLNELRNPGGFLHCIARNLAIDFARRSRCRIVTLSLTENGDGTSLPCQEDRLHAAETKQLLEEALAELPAKTARVFAMSRFEKKSYREIHLELGVGLSTVEYHMTRALAHLRRELAAEDV
ncbi:MULTISPECIES: sigma-70 family RNA polymerase sigma factor [Erythrobacteraceae]|uniref:Sigma-70 family RNA polymerase sigma factor n=1 Tax=Pelagerythrobacter aerophilus TaxID=2306995 RepID=A0A418NL03_9SPHN|nr:MULTISPECIES: sigma-70 family RNA polymerase sigma factor [Erythrobacteraceae]RIV80238.1 sigma-70 family RNA polymerase sigma factor [Pelagerythrobacter aerophilus]USA38864.1 sigma-70 family RNA polymerase sigma factor [Pelagerythrobacter marinus]WPZ07057.1 sigma-70 family RNA polymerase sigma factor [Pelagerythrobacter marinus]